LFGDEVAAGFDENTQGLEGLASDGNTSAVAEQEVLPEFQAKGAELVDDAGGFLAHSFRKTAEQNQAGQRTQALVRRVNGQRREPTWIASKL